MRLLSIWISAHRQLLVGTISIGLWVLANYWYFKRDIERIIRQRRPHTWSVDLEAKTGKGGRTDLH